MMLNVKTDRDTCIGSENCTRYAPHSFETDEEGKVVYIPNSDDSVERVVAAVRGCPVGALTLDDGSTQD
jgi:ferredoxin